MEFLFSALFVLYLAPWIVSEWRQRDDSAAILTLNLVAGWTVVGWLGALWWAGGDVLPQRPPARASLRLVPAPPDARERRAARGRHLAAAAVAGLAALLLLAGAAWLVRSAPDLATERVAVPELPLRAAPHDDAAVVARLPEGCVAAVTERRGEWRRLWRTAACPASARGRSAGWVRGAVTR